MVQIGEKSERRDGCRNGRQKYMDRLGDRIHICVKNKSVGDSIEGMDTVVLAM